MGDKMSELITPINVKYLSFILHHPSLFKKSLQLFLTSQKKYYLRLLQLLSIAQNFVIVSANLFSEILIINLKEYNTTTEIV